ncbi:hypothetical protein CO057_01355 [Candidatus Uhrbacteria bacterium CG_4_9_14_0_2_um_filter_41_50]|uniref:Uncharacterized protein n=1 Tax=Candidatus Uhrbacteria bacterium CG_4_9_14_0_2_um_filter_41_50 TaxID=1975031 RepID=A0A2M8EPN9_9BACT|nr:MAG: hypothetical protein CO057_01355 [Candidatus Uhrbacteria bacterium CG_4_9_14_0_2_um_filter_41_50]
MAVISYTPTMTELWLNLHRKSSFQVADFIHSPKLTGYSISVLNIFQPQINPPIKLAQDILLMILKQNRRTIKIKRP